MDHETSGLVRVSSIRQLVKVGDGPISHVSYNLERDQIEVISGGKPYRIDANGNIEEVTP